jgi:hypothetical protein
MYPFGETVTVRRWGIDSKDERVLLSTHTITDTFSAPRSATSTDMSITSTDRASTVVVGRTLYAPYGSDIENEDEILYSDGEIFWVDGDPFNWFNPYVNLKAVCEISLVRKRG